MAGILTIKDYIRSQFEISAPQVQREYGLTYIEMKKILSDMLNNDELVYKSGVTYSVKPNKRQSNKSQQENARNKDEELLLKALWFCIAKNAVTARMIERNLSVDFGDALWIIEQMEKYGYISHSPERRVLISADEYIYKFGRRAWVGERVADDVAVDSGGIICVAPGSDIKEKLINGISCHIGGSERGENEVYVHDNEGNIMFAIQEMPDYIQITDRGIVMGNCKLSRTKVKNALKKHKYITLSGDEITIAVKSYDYVLYGMMELYAAIAAIDACSEMVG